MNSPSNEQLPAPELSRMRTFLFWALAVVWFGEMALWGFQSLSEVWTNVWKMIPPENPQLAAALSMTHAVEAPLKGALGILSVFGLRSRNPSVRTALFIPMALVPPLNIAFQFRAQGFPFGSLMVASVLSTILWGSFFLLRETARGPQQGSTTNSYTALLTRREVFQNVWFVLNSVVLTGIAFLFLFLPRNALDFILPYLSSVPNIHEGELASLTISNLGTGTHLLALATASWVAVFYGRRSPTLKQAVAVASTINAALMCLMPLRRMIMEVGGEYAGSSLLIIFVPLLAGWLLYTAFSYSQELNTRQEAYT